MAKAKKKWTVMVYLAGDNNLDHNGVIDLKEMKKTGSTACNVKWVRVLNLELERKWGLNLTVVKRHHRTWTSQTLIKLRCT